MCYLYCHSCLAGTRDNTSNTLVIFPCIKSVIYNYCIVISADISISHRDCTGYKSLPRVLICIGYSIHKSAIRAYVSHESAVSLEA